MLTKNDKKEAEALLKLANAGVEPMAYWIKRIERNGVTEGLVRDLNTRIRDIPTLGSFYFDIGSRSMRHQVEIMPTGENVSPEALTAFTVADLLSNGILDHLNRCELPARMKILARKYPDLKEKVRAGRYECGNYFLSNKKGRWCSNGCGTKFRKAEGREKRNRDQILGSQQL